MENIKSLGENIQRLKTIRNKIYLIYLVVHLIITLCFLAYFVNLGLSVPYSTNEYSKVLGVFCYIGIFAFIIIILEVSVTILGVVTAIYMLVWYFIIRCKNKKLNNSIEQSTINLEDIT